MTTQILGEILKDFFFLNTSKNQTELVNLFPGEAVNSGRRLEWVLKGLHSAAPGLGARADARQVWGSFGRPRLGLWVGRRRLWLPCPEQAMTCPSGRVTLRGCRAPLRATVSSGREKSGRAPELGQRAGGASGTARGSPSSMARVKLCMYDEVFDF